MKRKFLALLAAVISLSPLTNPAALAAEGYKFDLKLTVPNAKHDPDGVWSDSDLAFYASQGFEVGIYTSKLTTPSGHWFLTQNSGDCNMQGMCTTLLFYRKGNGPMRQVSSAQVQQGGSAILSLNYRHLTTTEIGTNGKPFVGSYDVEATK